MGSHPSWVCGLKQLAGTKADGVSRVTPFVGVWIETCRRPSCSEEKPSHPSWVCGLKLGNNALSHTLIKSHPSWVCGLKHLVYEAFHTAYVSHPSWVCGLKPLRWWHHCALWSVTPFVGVWIETPKTHKIETGVNRHTLRGCVDWNISR